MREKTEVLAEEERIALDFINLYKKYRDKHRSGMTGMDEKRPEIRETFPGYKGTGKSS